ncbi:MAG: pyridoxamine 5'-phosphate oxidase family protein [Pyrinomonadaceae bacterium]|nr:pyridoxamine 5'-phosphate oxidase family protein [Pyrinomonadaceae bacterium]
MIEVEEMEMQEVHALLERADYGHLGCVRDNHPYVIPIHYAYQDPDIYIFTTEGMKTQFIATNPEVCLQVEEVVDPTNWKSVIATGKAARLTDKEEMESAMQYITTANPSLTPALNKLWNDPGGRASNITLYRIHPDIISGRKTLPPGETRGPASATNL